MKVYTNSDGNFVFGDTIIGAKALMVDDNGGKVYIEDTTSNKETRWEFDFSDVQDEDGNDLTWEEDSDLILKQLGLIS